MLGLLFYHQEVKTRLLKVEIKWWWFWKKGNNYSMYQDFTFFYLRRALPCFVWTFIQRSRDRWCKTRRHKTWSTSFYLVKVSHLSNRDYSSDSKFIFQPLHEFHVIECLVRRKLSEEEWRKHSPLHLSNTVTINSHQQI